MLRLLPLLLFPALASAASPNLTGKIRNAQIGDDDEGRKYVRFDVEVANTGDVAAEGNLRMKPFLVAREDERKSVVLPNLNASVSIGPGESATLAYRELLPTLASHDWWVGGVINPDWAIVEEGPRYKYDNTPDLVPVGQFAVGDGVYPDSGRFDFYGRVVDANATEWGSVSHSLRAIARGPSGGLDFPSASLRALFGVIDFETRKVMLLDYNRNSDPEDPEKAWYAISWYSEKDADNNETSVDYYWNNIQFGHVAPGAYRFFTLLNSRDLIEEPNFYDNMETLPLQLSLIEFPGRSMVLAASAANTATARTVALRGMYPGTVQYTAKLVSETAELSVDLGAGSLTDEGSIALNLPALAAGDYSAELKISAELNPGSGSTENYRQEYTIPVRYTVYDQAAPVLEVSETEISLYSRQEHDSDSKRLVLRNTGTAPMDFILHSDKPWIQLSQRAGRIEAGERVRIDVVATSVANLGADSDSYAEGNVWVESNTVAGASLAPIRIKLETRNQ